MGILSFPKDLSVISSKAFADNPFIQGLGFSDETVAIDAGAFANCYGISSITCNSATPPEIGEGAFEGVPKANFSVEVPEQALVSYQTAPGWREFARIVAHRDFSISRRMLRTLGKAQMKSLDLRAPSGAAWSIESKPDWLTVSPASGTGRAKLRVTTTDIPAGTGSGSGEIVFLLDGKDYRTSTTVEQFETYDEGEVINVFKHSKGRGVDLVFLGDCYDAKDIYEGKYMAEVNQAIEHFFSTVYDGETPRPLQVSGNWINNEAVTFDGTDWTPARKMIWAEGTQDVYAYYPYIGTVPSIEEYNFSVALDQTTEKNGSTLGGYEASDILWAKAEAVSKSGEVPDPVTLNFKHACAKVIIKLIPGEDFSGSFPDDAQMLIHNTAPEGVLDFSTGSVSKYLYGEAETIKCHRVQNPAGAEGPVYEAIVIPQRADSRRPFLEYNTGNISYLVEDTYNFRPGRCYTYTMTINSSPEQIVVSIGGSIEGWD